MSPLPRSRALLLILALASPAAGAPLARVARMAPVLEFAQAHAGFRASLVSQIALAGQLSAAPTPSLTPLLAPALTPADLWSPQAARLVGALVAQRHRLRSCVRA